MNTRSSLQTILRQKLPCVYLRLQRVFGWLLVKRFRNPEERFLHIYQTNHWDETESVSGPGSTLEETAPLRRELPGLLRKLEAASLLDIPCGDFHWMQHVDLSRIQYIGVDLVGELIEDNRVRYSRDGIKFRKLDLVRDNLPGADVVLCRDCLVHLSLADARAALANIVRSGARYLLTTSFPSVQKNDDIVTGQWRPVNLTRSPFHLSAPKETILENCGETEFQDKILGIWLVADVAAALEK